MLIRYRPFCFKTIFKTRSLRLKPTIDDVEPDSTTIHTGNVWSFWIPPKGAYNPSPANSQEVTDTDADLNWDDDWSPVMSVVHFGTDADQVTNAPEGFGPPLMERGFDPGPLEAGTTCYW